MMENAIDKNMLFESFAGRATLLQRQLIESWLREPGNQEQYYEWLDEWENAHPQFFPDREAALKKILLDGSALSGHAGAASRPSRRSRTTGYRMAVAAAIVLLIVACAWLLKDLILYKTLVTAYGETRTIVLPDGSLVALNANSSIRYARFGFASRDRELRLTGEADFTVIHTQSQLPFIVRTANDLDIAVLGTRFTVYARGMQTRVVLKQGKVELNYQENRQPRKLVLRPGELFSSEAGGVNKLEPVTHPENLSAWKNHEFIFDRTALTDIARMIRDDFGLQVEFDQPDIETYTISGSFHADTAGELLDVIAQLLNLHYQTKGDTIQVSRN